MTADASGVIIDTSKGQKDTEVVLQEQATKKDEGEVVKSHNAGAVDRAKTALLMRQKME